MQRNKAAFDSTMNALRVKYAAHLLERVKEMKELLPADDKNFAKEAREKLYNHAHSLAGSGTTYGYPDITKAARALESALDAGAALGVVTPLTHDLLGVCRSVASGQGTANAVVSNPPSKAKDKKTLLLIDDDASIHAYVIQVFKSEYNVVASSSGNDGLAAIHAERPDLVLLDGTLADLKGLNLLKTLKFDAATSEIPVIMVTAFNQSKYVEEAIKTGAADYVVKPLDAAVLQAKVRKLLARKSV